MGVWLGGPFKGLKGVASVWPLAPYRIRVRLTIRVRVGMRVGMRVRPC